MRGHRGCPIELDRIEDRAWLGALVTGEGTAWARTVVNTKVRQPYLVLAMQDKEAIMKAANSMGVTAGPAGVSKASGKRNWRTAAVGGRMLEVFVLIRPFLTSTKRRPIEKAIERARASGYLTLDETIGRTPRRILETVNRFPDSFGIENSRKVGIWCGSYSGKYLRSLERALSIRRTNVRTKLRPRFRWYPREGSS